MSNKINQIMFQKIAIPLEDCFTGTRINNTIKLLRDSQFWNAEHIEAYRLSKLKNILGFAFKNVPYYQEFSRKNNLDVRDIQKLEDLSILPIMTKDIMIERWKDLIPLNLDMKNVIVGKTGGTTGSPLVVYKDANSRTFIWGSYYRWYDWMGIKLGDRVASFWGARTVTSKSYQSIIKSKLLELLFNQRRFDSFKMSDKVVVENIRKLHKIHPALIKGYLSALLQLAEKLNEMRIYPFKELVALSSTTETLLPIHREYLQSTFNVPIYDQYGCGEIGGIAYECGAHRGLHVNQEHVIVEVLQDTEVNNPTEQTGQLMITDLDNYAMPFLRYMNGDHGTVKNFQCSCGVNQPLITRLDGRAIDTIKLSNGIKVHGVFFTDVFYELGILAKDVAKFQVYQHTDGEVEIRLMKKSDGSTIPKKQIAELHESLMKFFKKVNISFWDQLETEPNGKFKYIKYDANLDGKN